MIQVQDLTKTFTTRKSSKQVLGGISFTANDGEVFGLLGPNGAGKTTTLRTIATLLQPTSGRVLVDGMDIVAHGRAVRYRIGFLTGEMKLTGQLTGREMLEFFGNLDHMETARIQQRIGQLSLDLDMERFLDTPIAKLSSGMTQKVSLAISLLHEPHVIIFDEPTSNLDVLAVKIVSDFIRSAKEDGKCVVLSTHILSEAERLCDRIGILYEGRLLCEGPVDAVLEEHGARDLEQLFFQLVQQQKVPLC
ncbi:MAG TPA: ABC transporter ATP-binding protein [Sphaerochaeta sp.]|jgi:sodium transport system ATP-binding protein|nr:MAG: ABC transporter ATP-binding protein [Spirochaetes bacterium GWC2_52_13]PKL11445.1 MAG: ABC transporter ATP-binding protein [Spirochaetae bacterium HGW-Spirochaetae-8]PKL20505.1 MAG: ABC transporter ATP-binding protein [Spirochaetae bacterium HGW-Spirochaetae-4]HCG64434.1 ABC transporter ATP-binding protein [Sphaerochaeta sp.]HCJ93915.1 ABC transporter ATP-binding protein [Sphaerochaeta sp.]